MVAVRAWLSQPPSWIGVVAVEPQRAERNVRPAHSAARGSQPLASRGLGARGRVAKHQISSKHVKK